MFDGKHIVKAAREEKILKWLVKYDSDMLLFHHRNPTSTINVKRAAHPFSTKDYFGDTCYIMVHNGMISNPKEMKTKHEKLGIKYQSVLVDGTFNDSEALAWELALMLEGKQDKIEARGGIAFVCIKLVKGKKTHLFFGRNTSPLNMYRDSKGIALSSEGPGESIDRDKLYTFNYNLKRLTSKDFEIPTYYTTNYQNYTPNSWEDDEYMPYGNWKSPVKLGNAADDYLKRQFGTTYTVTESGVVLPDFEDDYFEFPLSEHKKREIEASIKPNKIENKIWGAIFRHDGVYSEAYYDLEDEYQDLLCAEATPETYKSIIIIEHAMGALLDDSDFVNETSVHRLWREFSEKED